MRRLRNCLRRRLLRLLRPELDLVLHRAEQYAAAQDKCLHDAMLGHMEVEHQEMVETMEFHERYYHKEQEDA